MLYYNENSDNIITKCLYFPLIPRLKRLHSSIVTASHMRWYSHNERNPTLLCHPSDGKAWKHFD
ncbi:hypothetical protein CR513_47534, partial [Mucuna pruriens]